MRIFDLGPQLAEQSEMEKGAAHIVVLTPGESLPMLEAAGADDPLMRELSDISLCKLEAHHRYSEGSLCIPTLDDIRGKRYRVRFFVAKDLLVFVDGGDMTDQVIRRARENPKDLVQSREKFLFDYFAVLLSGDLKFLQDTEAALFRMEERVVEGDDKGFRDETLRMRRDLLILREFYEGVSDMAEELSENDNMVCDEENLSYFTIIEGRADRLLNRADRLLDYLRQVSDTHREMLNEEQNRNMNYLSVISTIFLPLTLITGWFGMNFNNMPELEHGYPWVIAASIVIVAVIVFVFKKKKIL